MKKTYVGISRDHSGSMAGLAPAAMKDYNTQIDAIKEGSNTHKIDTIVSVIECGVNEAYSPRIGGGGYTTSITKNRFAVQNSSVNSLSRLESYAADGTNTPLYDAVGELIEQLEKVPDADNSDVNFLVMIITDGYENASKKFSASSLREKIEKLQKSDRWTFAFRVPRGLKHVITQGLGIPEGNVAEWEQTTRDLERVTAMNVGATENFYAATVRGVRSSSRFYSDLHNVKVKDVQNKLSEIKGFQVWKVKDKTQIKPFINDKLGKEMKVGAAFYQLMKPEKIQGHKQICIRHKYSGKVYTGDHARKLLGIPKGGEVKVYPGNHGDYDVFVQSTSTNRNLLPDTEVLYWEGIK